MSAAIPSPPLKPESEKPPDEIGAPLVEQKQTASPSQPSTGQLVAAYILIGLGAILLLATIIPLNSGVLVLAMGVTFLIVRMTTGNYGFAVPAGILLGIGAYAALSDAQVLPADHPGWVLIFLALGFLSIYPLGGRIGMIWPVFPAAILLAVGLGFFDLPLFTRLASYARIATYWPATLILIGAWLLIRDHVPVVARRPLGIAVISSVILYGTIALAAGLAASMNLIGSTGNSSGIWFATPSGGAGESTTLTEPAYPGDTLNIVNDTGGDTWVIVGADPEVRVQATRQSGLGPAASVQLTTNQGIISLEGRRAPGTGIRTSAVSFVVAVPREIPVTVQSSSGSVQIADRQADLQIENSSGNIDLARIDGAVSAHTSSGNMRLVDVSGNVRATTSSGSINGSGLRHVQFAQSSSGSIHLTGSFHQDAQIQTSSGSVNVGFTPDSSVRIAANTSSGSIGTTDLQLTSSSQTPHTLNAILGSGTGLLSITTSSGSIWLQAAR